VSARYSKETVAVGVGMKHKTCHRCGNCRPRASNVPCPSEECPIIYCKNCYGRALLAYGPSAFVAGCPVCLNLCCCSCRGPVCTSTLHCYRHCKFPAGSAQGAPTLSSAPVAAPASAAEQAAQAEETEDEDLSALLNLSVQIHQVTEVQECGSLFTGDDSSLGLSGKNNRMDTTD